MEKTDIRKAQELAFEELEAHARAKLLPDLRLDRRRPGDPPCLVDPAQRVERRRSEQRAHGCSERRSEPQGTETDQYWEGREGRFLAMMSQNRYTS